MVTPSSKITVADAPVVSKSRGVLATRFLLPPRGVRLICDRRRERQAGTDHTFIPSVGAADSQLSRRWRRIARRQSHILPRSEIKIAKVDTAGIGLKRPAVSIDLADQKGPCAYIHNGRAAFRRDER